MSTSPWWQQAIIYQVYPRSFQDSDGDGVGDLRGILQRLDYLSWLGVDAVWICPIYASPMADFGYDVADYVGSIRCSARGPISIAYGGAGCAPPLIGLAAYGS